MRTTISAMIADYREQVGNLTTRIASEFRDHRKMLELLTERMNRVEATVAHTAPSTTSQRSVDDAIRMLDHAADVFTKQTEEFERLKKQLRDGR